MYRERPDIATWKLEWLDGKPICREHHVAAIQRKGNRIGLDVEAGIG